MSPSGAAVTKLPTITRRDPRAVEKLEARIAGLTAQLEHMHAVNGVIRDMRANPFVRDEQIAARIVAVVGIPYTEALRLARPDRYQQRGFPNHMIDSVRASVRNYRKRIDHLQAMRKGLDHEPPARA